MGFSLALFIYAAIRAQTPPPAPAQPAPAPPIQKESVIVTGVYDPIPLSEADRSVTVIPVDAGQKLLSNTLFDLLRLDPALDVQSRGVDGIQTDISIHGGNFGQTLVLVDGLRLNDAQTGHFDAEIPIPPDAVGRLEILEGAGSAIYGSDAVGGVVNLITAQPESSEIHLRAAGGSFGTNQESASLSTVWSQASEQLFFSRDFSTGFTGDRDYRNLSAASLTHVRTSIGATDITLAYNDRPYGANQFYGPFNSWERTRTWFAGIRQQLGRNTEVSFAFRRHTDLFVLLRNDPAFYTNHHYEEGYQAAVRRHNKLRANTILSYGGEAFRDEIDSTNLGYHQRNYGAVYAAIDMRALSRYSFTLGAREELYKGGARQFNPTAAFGAWLSPKWKFRASASRAFRLPSYTDLYYSDPANLGNPYLKPETAWSYDAALEWAASDRVRATAEFFMMRERNGIDYVRTSPTSIWTAMNFDQLNFTGADAGVKIRAAKTQWIDLRFTAIHGAQDALDGLESKYVFNYPTVNAVAAWNAVLPKGFIARTRIGVMKRFSIDPYGVWDIYIANRHGRWSPFVQLTNLTSTNYQEIQGVAMPGRAILGGVDWRMPF
ncbi:MAG TPA: TonB-dependent receptor [Bryobacteraceae bacterium]|nr:TonB-dependent receptor [Bryobacteraceae bacterium]